MSTKPMTEGTDAMIPEGVVERALDAFANAERYWRFTHDYPAGETSEGRAYLMRAALSSYTGTRT